MGLYRRTAHGVKQGTDQAAHAAGVHADAFADGREGEQVRASERLKPQAGVAGGAEVHGVGQFQVFDGAFHDGRLEAAFAEEVQAQERGG